MYLKINSTTIAMMQIGDIYKCNIYITSKESILVRKKNMLLIRKYVKAAYVVIKNSVNNMYKNTLTEKYLCKAGIFIIKVYQKERKNMTNKNKLREMFNSIVLDATYKAQKKYGFEMGTGEHATWNNEADAFKHAYMSWMMIRCFLLQTV